MPPGLRTLHDPDAPEARPGLIHRHPVLPDHALEPVIKAGDLLAGSGGLECVSAGSELHLVGDAWAHGGLAADEFHLQPPRDGVEGDLGQTLRAGGGMDRACRWCRYCKRRAGSSCVQSSGWGGGPGGWLRRWRGRRGLPGCCGGRRPRRRGWRGGQRWPA